MKNVQIYFHHLFGVTTEKNGEYISRLDRNATSERTEEDTKTM